MSRTAETMAAADPAPPPRGALPPRVWLPIVALLMAAVAALAVLLVVNSRSDAPEAVACAPGSAGCELRQPVHWHADFALYLRGERYTFDQERFYSDAENELSENVHIHKPWHEVVHVHREGTTWREFLGSLGFEFTDSCLATPEGERFCNSEGERLAFILNGVRVDALAFQDITDIDRALISFGPVCEGDCEELWRQYAEVTDEACILSRLCLEREPPGGLPPEACGGYECN